MATELNNLVNDYVAWLKDKTVLREVGGWVEVTTPYLDRHNDYLQIYVKNDDGFYTLTDDAYIIQDLKMSGCDLESEKRLILLGQILNGFSVERKGDELITFATKENFPVRKHNLVQAMLAVDDLFYLAQPNVASLFFEDVASWLDLHDVRYTPDVKLTGLSGFDYKFDFVIPKSRNRPERIISTINYPDRKAAQNLFTAWVDIRSARSINASAYAFINDTLRPMPPAVAQALRKYQIEPIAWSHREDVADALAA